ncbi:MAG: UDP-N-acetylglucosamine 2-epimerase [Alphaproteobacteria bacterium]
MSGHDQQKPSPPPHPDPLPPGGERESRTIAVVTGARSDFGIYLPVLRAIRETPELDLRLMVCGMHLAPGFGDTVEDIRAAGFEPSDRIDTLLAADTPAGIAGSMGLGVLGFGQAFAARRPDLLLVLGDRYEMFAAAAAAVPFAIPLAHIHGGETTEGAFDEALRHALTKMSHLHFVATEPYRRRVVQLGEEPWRVHLVGAPGLDNLGQVPLLDDAALMARVGMALDPAPLLVTFHPVTLETEDTGDHATELMAALEALGRPVVFTYPNADTGGRRLIEAIDAYVARHADARAVRSLGTQAYFSLMRRAAAMVGNSSSGVIEAASFGLPVVDIGNRQKGRVRGENVIHAEPERMAIQAAIETATGASFREAVAGMVNPYGDGRAAGRIIEVLRDVALDRGLVEKRFYDLAGGRDDGE